MAKSTTPLTHTQINQSKPKDKEYSLCDGGGLFFRVRPTGSKSWVFKYTKPFTKTRTNLGLGSYPEVSLAQARDKRNDARELLAQDIDPKSAKDQKAFEQKAIHNNTLQVVAQNWFGVKESSISTGYAKDIWRSLELHIFPKLGKYPVTHLTAPLVIDTLKKVEKSGNLETVRRLAQRINEIMTYSVNIGLIPTNNLSGIKSAFEKPIAQHMATITPEELPELLRTLNQANLNLVTRSLIEWQLHTMTRSNESAKASWSEIDFENNLWIIPAERMKMKREHIVPLTKHALSLLEVLKDLKSAHNDFLFPSRTNPKKHINTETVNKVLRRIGYKDRLVAHGFRALASTTLNEQEFNPDVIEAALAHGEKNAVRKAYNRSKYLEPRLKLMIWWSNHIEKCGRGNLGVASGF